ncbi:MAG: hypothetical protein Q8L81_18300 [Bacteroidota bacterium]|nr:hypothetical protein [Bacteroidota bacterium]
METSINSKQGNNVFTNKKTKVTSASKFWENAEFNRFGIISMAILFIGCIGGFAASFGAHGDVIKLGMIVFPTILALAFILAVSPMKLIIYVCSLAILMDIAVLVF